MGLGDFMPKKVRESIDESKAVDLLLALVKLYSRLGPVWKLNGEDENGYSSGEEDGYSLTVYELEYELGQLLTVEQFVPGDRVDVVGKSKGRGFAGVVKRHGFSGGPRTHGQSDRLRAPGSIGATSGMSRVIKGLKMAGRMGNNRVSSQNLEVVRVDAENNLLAVKGSVPGAKGSLVVIRDAAKGK